SAHPVAAQPGCALSCPGNQADDLREYLLAASLHTATLRPRGSARIFPVVVSFGPTLSHFQRIEQGSRPTTFRILPIVDVTPAEWQCKITSRGRISPTTHVPL